jgi:GTPase SAR1 family protein
MSSKFGTINIQKLTEEESKPRGLDFSMRVAIIGSDMSGKTSFKDRFCFSRYVDPEEELLKAAKKKKKKKPKSGILQPLPLPPVVYECGTKHILWSPKTGCHWEDDVKEQPDDLYVEVLMVDSFQKYKTLNHRRGYLRGAQVVAVLYDVGDRESFDEAKELVKLVNDVCPEGGVLNYGSMGLGLSKMRGRIKTMEQGWGKKDETKNSIGETIPRTLDNETFVCGILIGCKCDKEFMSDEDIEKRKLEGGTPNHRVVSKEEGERYARDHHFFFHESSPVIDADPNRNRTKNTTTQVWTTHSTANDAIQKTINMCCCKWNNYAKNEFPDYFPKDPMPPVMKEEKMLEEQYPADDGGGGGEYDAAVEGVGDYGQEYAAVEGEYGQEEEGQYVAGEEEGQYVAGEEEGQYVAGEEEGQYVGGEDEQYVGGEEGQYVAEPVQEEVPVVEEEEDDY